MRHHATLHNSNGYHSYWMVCINNMISPRVKTLRLFEPIGYYSIFEHLTLDQWKGDNLGKFYNDLEGTWRAEFMAISTIEQKLAHDLHHESKEICCHVKKCHFGLEDFLRFGPLESVTPVTSYRGGMDQLKQGNLALINFSGASPVHMDSNKTNILNFERISNRHSARGSERSISVRSSGQKLDYLFESPGDFKHILDEFLFRSHELKVKRAIEISKLGSQELASEIEIIDANLREKNAQVDSENEEEPFYKKGEIFWLTEPEWDSLIKPEFLEGKYTFDPQEYQTKIK